MISIKDNAINTIEVEESWNDGDEKELLMHTIHTYPAKFPAFIATKAFDYASSEGVKVNSVADIFCGCGTVALESKVHGKDFWGCDINPVATLIARTKSSVYDPAQLSQLFYNIRAVYNSANVENDIYTKANERLRYWHTENSFIELYKIKSAIIETVCSSIYRDAFLCIFSSILKASSRWLTKSIKPQIDPNKSEIDVWQTFESHYNKFYRAVTELKYYYNNESVVEINNCNFLECNNAPRVDLIISSPPYVTSYEYADLHQLSSLWLGYTNDYRDLRKGSIGSVYNSIDFNIDFDLLNNVGRKIVRSLQGEKKATAKVKSIARYYTDIQNAVKNCSNMLNDGGMAFFVVGDTEYKGVQILNSEHLIATMKNEGFSDIKASKRIVSKKLLTPYRDDKGKFTSDKSKRAIYHEEYIITGRMWKN